MRVTLVPFLGEVVGASAELETVGGVSMLGLPQFDLSRSARIMKRGMDLIGATAGLAVAAPVIGLAAVLIKLDSSGPVLFRQVRTGRDGTRFGILKFRTMVDGAYSRGWRLDRSALSLWSRTKDAKVVGWFRHRLRLQPGGHRPPRRYSAQHASRSTT